MTAEEIQQEFSTNPETAATTVGAAMAAKEEAKTLAVQARRTAELAGQSAGTREAELLVKHKENLDEVHAFRELGTIEEVRALRARQDLDASEGESEAEKSLRLEIRTSQIEKEAYARKTSKEMSALETRIEVADDLAVGLQATADLQAVDEIIRKASSGRHIEDAFDDLARRLRPCFNKEPDGSYTIVKPGTDELLRDAGGIYLTPVTLVEQAMEGLGEDPWNSKMSYCFKPVEGGSGTRKTGGKARVKKLEDMTLDDRLDFIRNGGTPEQFSAIVNEATDRTIKKMKRSAESADR